jgi:hypothetical protein
MSFVSCSRRTPPGHPRRSRAIGDRATADEGKAELEAFAATHGIPLEIIGAKD